MPNMPDPEKVDADSPELTEDFFRRAKPGADALPHMLGEELAGKILRRGRGPSKVPAKVLISLRLDGDVIEHFRATGEGWQARMNTILRKAAKLKPVKAPTR